MTDYSVLASQYAATEAALRERIADLRIQMRGMPLNDERDAVKQRISTMQDEIYDVTLVRMELECRQKEEENDAAC